mgnify:CR=1 FL=1
MLDVDEDDKNNLLVGDEDGRSGDTLPVSLSLEAEEGGVGGRYPITLKQRI